MSLELLLEAVGEGNEEQIRKSLAEDQSLVNRMLPNQLGHNFKVTPLIVACMSNQLDAMKILIDKGADVNLLTNDKNSTTALIEFIECGNRGCTIAPEKWCQG